MRSSQEVFSTEEIGEIAVAYIEGLNKFENIFMTGLDMVVARNLKEDIKFQNGFQVKIPLTDVIRETLLINKLELDAMEKITKLVATEYRIAINAMYKDRDNFTESFHTEMVTQEVDTRNYEDDDYNLSL